MAYEGGWAILAAQEGRTEQRETQRENSARLAYSVHTVNSAGVGVFALAGAVDFDVTFLERPIFTQGALVRKGDIGEDWFPPLGSASVTRWKRNTKGFYTGAWVTLEVRMMRVDGGYAYDPPKVKMAHDLVFMGNAYKDLGQDVAIESATVASRPVGYGGVKNG